MIKIYKNFLMRMNKTIKWVEFIVFTTTIIVSIRDDYMGLAIAMFLILLVAIYEFKRGKNIIDNLKTF